MDIFSTVESAISLSERLLTYLSEYKGASRDRDLLEKEVKVVADLLPTLRGHIERLLGEGSFGDSDSPTVAALSAVLTESKMILDDIEKTLRKAKEKMDKIMTKLLWPFKKADLEKQIQKLTQIKSYLREAVEYGTM